MPNQLAPGTKGFLLSATPPRRRTRIDPKSLAAFPVCRRCAINFLFFFPNFFFREKIDLSFLDAMGRGPETLRRCHMSEGDERRYEEACEEFSHRPLEV